MHKKKKNVRHIIVIYMGLKNIIISYLYQGQKKRKKEKESPFSVLAWSSCVVHSFVYKTLFC